MCPDFSIPEKSLHTRASLQCLNCHLLEACFWVLLVPLSNAYHLVWDTGLLLSFVYTSGLMSSWSPKERKCSVTF